MSLTALAIEKRTVTYFVVFLFILGGIGAFFSLGQLEDPEFTIKEALISFGAWIEAAKGEGILDLQRVWGNGATFDITIIENAMDKFKAFYSHLLPPWKFWQIRDVRTLQDIATAAGCEDFKKTLPFSGIKHDALADAVFQAQYVSEYWIYLKGGA